MPAHEWVLPAIIILPLVATPLAGSLYRSRSSQAWLAMAALEADVVLTAWLVTLLGAGQRSAITFAAASLLDLRFQLALSVDQLSAFFLLILLLVGLANVMFFAARDQAAAFRGYQEPLVLLSLFSALAAVASANLLTFYLFWQLTIFCETLVLAAGPGDRSLQGVLKYVVANEAGALLLFFAVSLSFARGTGGDVAVALATADPGLRTVLLGLVVVSGLLGAGAFPFHTWFTSAAEAGPPSLASYVLGMQNKLGLFLLLRIVVGGLGGVSGQELLVVLAVLGALSVVGGALGALVRREVRGSLALLMVTQTGFVLLGLSTGERLGLAGALFLVFGQSLALVAVWLSLEAVRTRMAEPESLGAGGLLRTMPLAAAGYAVGALSLVGLPLLPGYAGQALVYRGLFASGAPWHAALVAAGLVGGLLTAVVLVRLGSRVFLGPRIPPLMPVAPANGFAQGSLALLLVFIIGAGILPGLVANAFIAPITGVKFLGGWGDLIYAVQVGRAVVLWTVPLTIVLLVLPLAVTVLARVLGRRPVLPENEESVPLTPARLVGALSAGDGVVPGFGTAVPFAAKAASWVSRAADWNVDPYDITRNAVSLVSLAVARALRLTFRILVG